MAGVQTGVSRFRTLSGGLYFLTKLLLIAISVIAVFFILDIPFYLKWPDLRGQYYGIFLGLALPCIFLIASPTRTAARDRVPWYDVILCIVGFGVGLYIALFYRGILERLGDITPDCQYRSSYQSKEPMKACRHPFSINSQIWVSYRRSNLRYFACIT